MLSIVIPASSNALYVHCRRSFCCGSMKSASASLMPKNLWSNSLNLKFEKQNIDHNSNISQQNDELNLNSLNRWCLPFYKSCFGCLCFSRFAIISIIPKGGVKPLCWNIHNAVLSLRQNTPEIVQPLTWNEIPNKWSYDNWKNSNDACNSVII